MRVAYNQVHENRQNTERKSDYNWIIGDQYTDLYSAVVSWRYTEQSVHV